MKDVEESGTYAARKVEREREWKLWYRETMKNWKQISGELKNV